MRGGSIEIREAHVASRCFAGLSGRALGTDRLETLVEIEKARLSHRILPGCRCRDT